MSKNTKRPFFKGLRKSSGGGGSGSGSVALSPEPSPPLPRSRSPFSLFRRHHDTPTSASAPSSAASFVSTTSVVSPVLAIPTTLPTTPTPATPPTLVIPDPQIVVNNSIAPLPCAWEETIEIAKKKLHDHGLPDLCESPGLRADQIIQLAIGDLETAIVQKNSAGVLRIQNVLKTIDGYAKIVDTAIQHSPEVTSLVWAGARAMLQIALNHIEITEALEAATALIAEKMAICEFYASVYEETRRSRIDISSAAATKLQRTLDSSLPELYAAVLVFSVKGHQYFSSSTSRVTKWKLLLKPYSMEFKPFIDDILEKEKRVRECADLATMDTIKKNSGNLAQLQLDLTDIGLSLGSLCKLDDIATYLTSAEAERVHNLLRLLSPLESMKWHQDVRANRIEGTGTWFLDHEYFKRWRDSPMDDPENRILCCYGNPGVGKTVLCSLAFDNLAATFPHRDYIAIACVYCHYRDQESQTLVNILGSIVHQFLSTASVVPDQVIRHLEGVQRRNQRVTTQDITTIYGYIQRNANFTQAFICIDALDELKTETRFSLLDALRETFNTAAILLTGRPHVAHDVSGALGTRSGDSIQVVPNSGDIKAYIRHTIKGDRRMIPDAMDDDLEKEILDSIIRGFKDIFILPVLHIQIVLQQPTKHTRRKALGNLPPTLDGAYRCMVERISQSLVGHASIAKRTLLLLHLAHRQLGLDEIQHALAVESGTTSLNIDNIPSRKTILDCCLGLVIVDDESMTVRFVHFTLEEFFRQFGTEVFPDGPASVLEICLTYLNHDVFSESCASVGELMYLMKEYPFLEYSTLNWASFALKDIDNRCTTPLKDIDNRCTTLAIKFLRSKGETASAAFQLWWHEKFVATQYVIALNVTGSHVAAYYGLIYYLKLLMADEDTNQRDDIGRTPLEYAVFWGHEGIARLLLEQGGVDVNARTAAEDTLLAIAAWMGHEGIVRVLLEHSGVDVDARDWYERTPLMHAAEWGQEGIVRLLLEHGGVDIDARDGHKCTPLAIAATKGHEGIVRLLLEHGGVDVNTRDKVEDTPFAHAVRQGHEGIVRLLLEHGGVDVNAIDGEDSPPLAHAVRQGNEGIVRLLLEHGGVDVNARTAAEDTLLAIAAWMGHEGIVRLLLEHGGVDVDARDWYERTPLMHAAEWGQEGIVRLLLEHGGVDVDARDFYERTPLIHAAEWGQEGIVRLLLEHGGVDVNTRDKSKYTPLAYAAEWGQEGIVRLLLERPDLDVNVRVYDGNTVLSYAKRRNMDVIVSLILAHPSYVSDTDV